jgi:hypothetical protein
MLVLSDCAMKNECIRTLYEFAHNPMNSSKQCLRALHFCDVLKKKDVDYDEIILTNIELLYYVGRALESCADAPYPDSEVRRDDIRCSLAKVVPDYHPRLRSYPSDDSGDDAL